MFPITPCLLLLLPSASAFATPPARGGRGIASRRLRADVYYPTEMADRFSAFVLKQLSAVDEVHVEERERLAKAIGQASTERGKMLLETAAMVDEEDRLETKYALNGMLNFATTLRQAMGAEGSAASCQELTCGPHAFCMALATGRAGCRCEEGFEGNGFICNPPLVQFLERPLFSAAGRQPQVADLHVATLRGSRVAVAFRDVSQLHKGYIILGQVSQKGVAWGPPALFSNRSQAFNAAMVELQDGSGLAIAFRDKNRGGLGFLVGAATGETDTKVAAGQAKAFARNQGQSMAVIPLSGSRVAVLFVEHAAAAAGGEDMTAAPTYATALVAEVHADGSVPEIFGKHRFVSGPVARLSVAALSPSTFAVGFRLGDGVGAGPHGEASCIALQVRGNELVFAAQPVTLEPDRTQIWARSLVPLTETTFAYVYHSGNEQLTKQAVLQVDRETHKVSVIQQPVVVGHGFTPYIGSVTTSTIHAEQQTADQSALLEKEGPRVFVYFSDSDTAKARARLCKVDMQGVPAGCRELMWSTHELVSVAGAPIGDGRALVAYTDARGTPFYQLIGLMEPV